MLQEYIFYSVLGMLIFFNILFSIFIKLNKKARYSLKIINMLISIALGIIILNLYPGINLIAANAIIFIVLIILLRLIQVISIDKSISNIPVYEISAFSLLTIVLTYTVDIAIGATNFNIFTTISVFLILIGAILISKKNYGLEKNRLILFIFILTKVIMGYIAYFSINTIGLINYIVLITVISFFIITPLSKIGVQKEANLFIKTKSSVLKLSTLLATTLIAFQSATLFIMFRPFIIFLTLLLSSFIAGSKIKLTSIKEKIPEFIIIIGILSYLTFQLI